MSEEIYDWMNPGERLARAYRNRGPVEKAPRPYQVQVTLTAEEEAELAGLDRHERLTRFRAIREARTHAK